jgi:hypothetical protein
MLAPGYSFCYRCGMPWGRVDPHITNYSMTEGCFALCEECWTILGHPEARIEYYEMLYNDWWERRNEKGPLTEAQHELYIRGLVETKALIGKAVANGG